MISFRDGTLQWPLRYLSVLITGALLLLVQGCGDKIPLLEEDILGRIWLQESHGEEGVDGFYATTGGQLRLINRHHMDGVYWEVHEDRLLLWVRYQDQTNLHLLEYHPLLIDGEMSLSASSELLTSTYSAMPLQEPLDNIPYVPATLDGSPVEKPSRTGPEPYLQLDTSDGSLRGFGGVNNFHGTYQRIGPVGFKTGPMAATRMSGPGMDYELRFMQCLDQADTFLAVRRMLFFYQGSRLACSLQTN